MSKIRKMEKTNRRLSREITNMAETDQKWRAKIIEYSKAGEKSAKINKICLKIQTIDKRHTNRLKEIVAQYGWPTISLVGKDASNKAWLIVQHADNNLNFQEKCLGLIKKAIHQQNVSLQNFAYLSDRIRVAKSLPQLFGTQFRSNENGQMVPFPVYKQKTLNDRRKRYGLGSFEKNFKRISRQYDQPKKKAGL